MKKLCILLLIFLSMTITEAAKAPRSGKVKARISRSISEQVSAFLSFPESLAQESKRAAGIVVIQFQIDEENRLGKLQVHSGNDRLNADLIQQLTGRKLHITDFSPFDTYTLRLHFQPASSSK